ncbi:MAG TPA: DUF1330 domain-containing protein [Pseudonocardiaceae bacterium]|nr:DUF1330 domain-containing protein [Pseudonocardiaceae bacterium]
MSKGYWVVAYQSISDQDRLTAYGKLAGPAVADAGGKFLARGGQVVPHEAGLNQRTVLVEFPSYEAALAAYDTPDYRKALETLGDAAVRDLRIIEGVD